MWKLFFCDNENKNIDEKVWNNNLFGLSFKNGSVLKTEEVYKSIYQSVFLLLHVFSSTLEQRLNPLIFVLLRQFRTVLVEPT